jgi:hypothetical protein
MALPRWCESNARPTASRSVWHCFHIRDRRDTACCVGRIKELRTSLTSLGTSTRMHFDCEAQPLWWPRHRQHLTIEQSRKGWSLWPRRNQSLSEVLQFTPDESFGSRTDYQPACRTSLSCPTNGAVLRSTDLPIQFCGRHIVHKHKWIDGFAQREWSTPKTQPTIFRDDGIVPIATDAFSDGVCPPPFARASPSEPLHPILMSQPGIAPGLLGGLDPVAADHLDKSVFGDFLTNAILDKRRSIGWSTINLFSKRELARARPISRHPKYSNLVRSSVSLGHRGSRERCGPISGHAS